MKHLFFSLALLSVPSLLMLQSWQAYRYVLINEELSLLESAQRDRLEENKRLVAGISAFDSPARVYQIAREDLDLSEPVPGNILQVRFIDGAEVDP